MQNLERRNGYRKGLFMDYIRHEWSKFGEQDSIFDIIGTALIVAIVWSLLA